MLSIVEDNSVEFVRLRLFGHEQNLNFRDQ